MPTTTSPGRSCEPVPLRGDPRALLPPPTAESAEAILGGGFELLASLRLPSRLQAEERLARVIEAAAAYSREGAPQSVVLAVVGEWGLGKSHAARLVERLAPPGLGVRRVVFDDLVEVVDGLQRRLGRQPSEGEAREALAGALASGGLPALVVVDEVESLIGAAGSGSPLKRLTAEAFFDLVKALLNPEIGYASGLRGRLHLALLLTPAAFHALRGHLQERGIAGKLLRRIEKVRLRPLEKHETIELVGALVRASLGVEPGRLFSDPRLLEAIHEASGGNPGNAVSLAVQVILHNACPGGGACACRVTPERMLEALSESFLVDEAGDAYRAADPHLASTLLTYASGSREALILALGSASPAGEAGRGAVEALSRAGLDPEVGVGVPLGGSAADVSRWLSQAAARACGGDGECREALTRALSHLVHLTRGGGYVAVLPREPGELARWLELLGWDPGMGRVEGVLEASPGGGGEYLVVPPDRLSRLLPVHGVMGVAYVRDPQARELLRRRLRGLEGDPAAYAGHVADGLRLVLVEALGLRDSGLGRLSWRPKYGDEVYSARVVVDATPLLGGQPECRQDATITIVAHHEDQPVEAGCPTHVPLPLPHGIARRLAALSLARRVAGGSIDPGLEREEAEDIARRLDLERALESALPRLETAGVLVRPHTRGLELARRLLGRSGASNAGLLLADTHRLLVALGGARGPVGLEGLAGAIEALARATPYSRSARRWCRLRRIPSFSVLDIRDESPESLARLVSSSLEALAAEGLAEAGDEGYRSAAAGDPILCRLLLAGARPGSGGEVPEEYFILPAGPASREASRQRLQARLKAVEHLGLEAAVWRGGSCTPSAPRAEPPPAPPSEPGRLLGELDAIAGEVEALAGARPRWFPSIVVCKAKGCKAITRRDMEELAAAADSILSRGSLYPAEAELAGSLVSMLEGYVDLARAAAASIASSYRRALDEAGGLSSAVARIRRLVGELEARGLRADVAGRVGEALDYIASHLGAGEARAALARGLERGDEAVEAALSRGSPPGGDRHRYDFANCSSTFSPHHYMAEEELGRLTARYERARKALERAASALEAAIRRLASLQPESPSAALAGVEARLPHPSGDPEALAADLARSLEVLGELVEREASRLAGLAEARRMLEEAVRGLPDPQRLAGRAGELRGRLERLEGWASLLGVGGGEAERARGELESIGEELEEYRRGHASLLERLSTGACEGEQAGECLHEAGRLRDQAGRLRARLDSAAASLDRLERLLRGEVERARRDLESLAGRVKGLAASLLEARELDAPTLAEVNAALEAAEDALRRAGAPGVEPPAALAALREARARLERVAGRLLGGPGAGLYELLLEIRSRGPLPLGEILARLEEAGWGGERLAEGLRGLEELAERLGVRLVLGASSG
ncbi:MAG: hypothetical protein LRS49_06460 [Desulfurococcales archaeon]|nr:hypothetical protein [Desulfurococcales archaeon]